jgi:hypothetical protein
MEAGLNEYKTALKAFGEAFKKCLALGLAPAEIIGNCPDPGVAQRDADRLKLLNAQPNMEARSKWAPTK